MDQPAALDNPQLQEAIDRFMPYLHEVRKKLLVLAIVFTIFAALGFAFYQKILLFIMGLFNLKGITIVLTSPYQFIDLSINTALVMGIAAVIPFLLFDILSFIRPALTKPEFKLLQRLVPFTIILFAAGFAFGLWIMNIVINIFYQTTQSFNLNNLWDISHFFTQTLVMAISLGIVFEFPVVLTALLRLHVVKRQFLVKSRRYIYAALIIFATLMPPTDLLSLTLITIPLILLFELTMLFNQPHHLLLPKEVKHHV